MGDVYPGYVAVTSPPTIVRGVAATGDVRWSFQTVHDDVWDYDLGSQPTLIDLPSDAGSVPAMILPTKLGVYALNRATGEPLTSVEERPAPQHGAAPGNEPSPTQPHSTAMPVLRQPRLTERVCVGRRRAARRRPSDADETNGEQYVAIMAGGHHFMETRAGDYVIAYKLP